MMEDSNKYIQLITDTLAGQDFNDEPSELFAPISYTMSLGGKRIRPLLALLACRMFDGDIKDVLHPALGYEVFHNFTLIHDDILDKADIRRGKETVYKKWDTNIAILAGDTMFALAYTYFFKTKPEFVVPSLQIFNKTAIDVCRGQQYDMNFETIQDVSIEDYIEMIRLKTAVLLGACAKTGVLIGGGSNAEALKAYDFSEYLGIAFQLKDDLLDLYADTNLFGKKIGGDISSCKKSFLFVKALSILSGKEKDDFLSLYHNKVIGLPQKIDSVSNIYQQLNIKTHTEEVIQMYYRKAIQRLDSIDVAEEKKADLYQFASQLMQRKH